MPAHSFASGETQEDSFAIPCCRSRRLLELTRGSLCLIPTVQPEAALGLGIACQGIEAGTDLSGYDILIVGKSALSSMVLRHPSTAFETVSKSSSSNRPRRCSKNGSDFASKNWVAQVFPRIPNHPILSGVAVDTLRDWRGEGTILSRQLDYQLRPRYGPTVRWCDIPVLHVWRCGNQGNVASVLIEKPARGNFLPVVDGGFSLQYSPLLEYHEGQGLVLFCQLDVTGRSEPIPPRNPGAEHARLPGDWRPMTGRTIVYAGLPAGLRHLESAGFRATRFEGRDLSRDQILVVGPGAGKELAGERERRSPGGSIRRPRAGNRAR